MFRVGESLELGKLLEAPLNMLGLPIPSEEHR